MEEITEYDNTILGMSPEHDLPYACSIYNLGVTALITIWIVGPVGLVCSILALVRAKGDLALYRENPGIYSFASYQKVIAGRKYALLAIVLPPTLIVVCVIFIFLWLAWAYKH